MMVVPGSRGGEARGRARGPARGLPGRRRRMARGGCSMCIAMNGDQLVARPVRDQHLEPELRGPPGQGRTDVPRLAADRGRVGDHRRRHRPADAARHRGPGRRRRALTMAEPFRGLHERGHPAAGRERRHRPDRPGPLPQGHRQGRASRDALFHDWRYDEDGGLKEPLFVMDRLAMADRQILLVGDNFGTGSSREHAPWALRRLGHPGDPVDHRSPTSSAATRSRTACCRSSSRPTSTSACSSSSRRPRRRAAPSTSRRRSSTCPATRTPVRRRPVRQADAARRDRRDRLSARPRVPAIEAWEAGHPARVDTLGGG